MDSTLVVNPECYFYISANRQIKKSTDIKIQTGSWNNDNTPNCGDTNIIISGNGASSTNNVNVSSNCSTTINQSNDTEIKTDINIISSTSSANIYNQYSSDSAKFD